jgi:hypothetical protein
MQEIFDNYFCNLVPCLINCAGTAISRIGGTEQDRPLTPSWSKPKQTSYSPDAFDCTFSFLGAAGRRGGVSRSIYFPFQSSACWPMSRERGEDRPIEICDPARPKDERPVLRPKTCTLHQTLPDLPLHSKISNLVCLFLFFPSLCFALFFSSPLIHCFN